jgi:hypothetical protein
MLSNPSKPCCRRPFYTIPLAGRAEHRTTKPSAATAPSLADSSNVFADAGDCTSIDAGRARWLSATIGRKIFRDKSRKNNCN